MLDPAWYIYLLQNLMPHNQRSLPGDNKSFFSGREGQGWRMGRSGGADGLQFSHSQRGAAADATVCIQEKKAENI